MTTYAATKFGFLPVDNGPNWHRFRNDLAYILECEPSEIDEVTWRPYYDRHLTAPAAIKERHEAKLPLPGPLNG